jgi:hypothetical protein
MSNADVSAILGPIRETHNSIVKYFAQTPRPAADYTKAKFGMVMGTADLHNTDDSTQWTGAWRDPANGIIGFSDAVVQNLLVGPSSDNVSNIVPSALSFTSANGPYKIRWSVTTFGADLMHFDVEHTSSGGMVRPSAPDMKAYDGFVVTLVSTTQSDGKNPWFG